MTYAQILAHFTNNPTHWGDNHGNLAEHVTDFINNYYSDELDTVADIDDMTDNISEYADNETPIYYNDIAKWFAENWNAVNCYVQDIGAPESRNFDIMRTIQAAYCYTLDGELRELLQETIDGYEEPEATEEETPDFPF
jgi:hypothetical protein